MGDNSSSPSQDRNYLVGIGYHTVMVSGDSIVDAVREAKRRLCLELPRMWDVIAAKGPHQFDVTRLE